MLDFETSSLVEPAFLITIVTEDVLKDSIVTLLKHLKVKSYSVAPIQGEARYAGLRQAVSPPADAETANREITIATTLEIRAIVSQELSNVVFYALKEHKRSFAITAYRQPIDVLIDE